jgi:uncharacterized membrane protein YphA (DoxX/SURF4 family)/thiol-disulfide isomerase/thioredoxin
MNKLLRNKWFVLACRLGLGVILITASISKILDMEGFVNTVVSYQLIPSPFAEIYGWIMPWVELALGSALLLGVLPRLSAAFSVLIVISFAIASTYALEKFPDSTCGCFGSFILLSHPLSLTIDGIMFSMALVVLASKIPEVATLGQKFNRINPELRTTKKMSYFTALIGTVVLLMGAIAGVSYGVNSLVSSFNETESTQQKVNIIPPISDAVEASVSAGKPVMLYVFADGCSSCEEVKPAIEEAAGAYTGAISYIKIDYYRYTSQLIEMGISSTPTVWIITGKNNDGTFNLLEKFGGSLDSTGLKNALEKAIDITGR